jgi:glycosyltransferase involved in cell wall biosynthesis
MRVAVISTSLGEDMNILWRATEGLVKEQLLIGPRSTASSGSVAGLTLSLKDRDLGRGLIWQHLSGLRRELKRFDPDLVHVNGELWTIRALQVATSNHPFVVHGAENVWSHGHAVERAVRDRLVPGVLARSSGYASWNVQGAGHAVRVVGNDDFPTVVVPAVIPPDVFRQARWQAPPSDVLRILLVGRLDRQKGFHLVLEAAASWPGRITVTICGEGSQREALAAQAAHLGVATQFVGQVDAATLATLMAEHSVLIQPSVTTPSRVEQFGRTVAEALCVGIPVLTSDSGELPNLMDRHSKWTFGQDSAAAVHEALSELVDQPAEVLELSHAQRRLAHQVDPAQAASKIVDFWHRAAGYEARTWRAGISAGSRRHLIRRSGGK